MSRKNLFKIIVVTGIVLFIPFIAMLFKDEVRWSTFDFVLMGLMIFSSVLLGVTLQKKLKIPKKEYWSWSFYSCYFYWFGRNWRLVFLTRSLQEVKIIKSITIKFLKTLRGFPLDGIGHLEALKKTNRLVIKTYWFGKSFGLWVWKRQHHFTAIQKRP